MIDSVSYQSPQLLSQTAASGQERRPPQLDLPPEPGPVEQLRTELDKIGVGGQEAAARSSQVLAATDGNTGVSDTGIANVTKLTAVLAEKRAEATTSKISAQYGESAAKFVSDTGQLDRIGLQKYLAEQDSSSPLPDEESLYDFRAEVGYGPDAQATKGPAANFIEVRA